MLETIALIGHGSQQMLMQVICLFGFKFRIQISAKRIYWPIQMKVDGLKFSEAMATSIGR